jgi:hypothetical protein
MLPDNRFIKRTTPAATLFRDEQFLGGAKTITVTTWYGLLHYANLIRRTGPVIFFSTYLI